jgi:ABC-type antimicrobial peptide transport system permease subunit
MTFVRLLLRNLTWHWRPNLAVLLGVVVGTAALTGALLVGDSLRGSLRAMALDQLGWVDEALVAGRFFSEELAHKLPASKVSAAILLECSASKTGPESFRANRVTLLAVDDRFWPKDEMPLGDEFWRGSLDAVVLNRALAERLHVEVGDKVTFFLQSVDNVPRETLIGKRKSDDVLTRLEVTVKAIVPDTGMGCFTLRPSPAPPLNAFVPLGLIQGQYDAEKKKYPLKGRVNALLVGGAKSELAGALSEHLTLDDWNLVLRTPADRARELFRLLAAGEDRRPDWQGKVRKYRWNGRIPDELARQANASGDLTLEQFVDFFSKNHNYVSLESSQVFIDPDAERAAEVAADPDIHYAPTLAYMVDTLSDGKNQAPYVIVAALDPSSPPPLGPIQPLAEPPLGYLEILVAKWPGCPLQLTKGQPVTLSYDVPDTAGKLERKEQKLTFAGWIPLEGAADDPDLTPRFEGITDRLTIRDWADNLPFTVDKRRLKLADSEFWDRYRATPKAYVDLATGRQLWGTRFGNVTSIRLAGASGDKPHRSSEFERVLLTLLNPAEGGFIFNNVKEQALAAGQGSSDFGMLFIGFSFFLIVAAMLLVGLMFRLNLDRRASEMGLLLAVGWQRTTVRRLALAEGTILGGFGGAIGVGLACLYAGLLLDYLGHLWPGGMDRSFLQLHVTWGSMVVGYVASLVISVLTIWWTTRVLAKVPPQSLLAGETVASTLTGPRRLRLSLCIAAVSTLFAVGCIFAGVIASDHQAQAGSFMGSGVFVLSAFLAILWWWMQRTSHGRALPGLARLGLRNAARHPVRSILTIGLLAAAVFMVVAVQAFHRNPTHDFLAPSGGSGGFAWVGETTVPIFQDLNMPAGRLALHLPKDLDARVVAFRVQPGDDVSCLNLYRPTKPRILGVPQTLIDRGGFHFAQVEPSPTDDPITNPWEILLHGRRGLRSEVDPITKAWEELFPHRSAVSNTVYGYPAIGEANTVKWILKSNLGQTISHGDGNAVQIVALLQDSVFQSELLISEENFLKLFPRQEGFQFFLIDAPPGKQGDDIRRTLETALADYGFSMTPAQQRLQSYLDVENTYLATFQALGGLGLLLGSLGLAVVLVRTVWERRGELALMRALGFRRSTLGWLVLAENAWLLLLGLAAGCMAATVAIAPFMTSQAGDVFQWRMLGLLGLVVIVGLSAGVLAVSATLRAPLLAALRRE